MNVPKSVRTILKIIVQFVIVVLVLFGARDVVHQIGDYLGLSLPHNDNLMIVVVRSLSSSSLVGASAINLLRGLS